MPTHCCVPECNQKEYKNEKKEKVSFFEFPTECNWAEKVDPRNTERRGEGLSLNKNNKDLLRRFRPSELRKSLNRSRVSGITEEKEASYGKTSFASWKNKEGGRGAIIQQLYFIWFCGYKWSREHFGV